MTDSVHISAYALTVFASLFKEELPQEVSLLRESLAYRASFFIMNGLVWLKYIIYFILALSKSIKHIHILFVQLLPYFLMRMGHFQDQ